LVGSAALLLHLTALDTVALEKNLSFLLTNVKPANWFPSWRHYYGAPQSCIQNFDIENPLKTDS
jgi:hypothetical protein